MPGQVKSIPTFALTPSSERTPTTENYITNFDFLNQYLPDTYEKEFERYGNRSISSFLRMVGAEMPTNSDMIKWAEQGRLHIKYVNVNADSAVNTDELAQFFYEQGKSNATEDVMRKTKNINMSERRVPESTQKGGMQFKSLSQASSRGLKIKSIKKK